MKVFIWQYVDQCSENYHSEGGVVVLAEDEAYARRMANAVDGCSIKDTEMPDYVRDVAGCEGRAFIFPDAGCC